ncbi:MAG: flagellar protein FlaG [Bdellovibrionales bacterium]|nr:flagellar protein FlaG [Bdellovibrionales bacterium]
MNIKGVKSAITYDLKKIKEQQKRSEQTTDRDANGQMPHGEHQKKKFTEEEIKIAVEKMKNFDGIKNNNLNVRFEQVQSIYVVYVEDMTGKVIRRIPESDLVSFLNQDEIKPSGHILNRAS